jgi:hypothetical protein
MILPKNIVYKNNKTPSNKTKVADLWVPLPQSRKVVGSQDVYILGSSEVSMPSIVATSSVHGIKARLVTCKNSKKLVSTTLQSDADKEINTGIKVINEWTFEEGEYSKPIFFEGQKTFTSDVWVEMSNPTDKDAAVNALLHGVIKTRG